MKSFIFFVLFCFSTKTFALPLSDSHGSKPKSISSSNEIVFIHGMFVTPESWGPWLEYFSHYYRVSAPAWPFHDQSPAFLRAHFDFLGHLDLSTILDRYRKILTPKKDNPPILIGHSMGGLIAQILLSEGLGSAAVAINSASPKSVTAFTFASLKINWPFFNPLLKSEEPVHLTFEEFSFAFTNMQPDHIKRQAYEKFYVPESRKVGRAPLTEVAKIDCYKRRGPLLIIAGGADNIIPAKLNYENFKYYSADSSNYTEFQLFEGRDHWTIAGVGWQRVATFVENWLNQKSK